MYARPWELGRTRRKPVLSAAATYRLTVFLHIERQLRRDPLVLRSAHPVPERFLDFTIVISG
jgi:hypothetical protein